MTFPVPLRNACAPGVLSAAASAFAAFVDDAFVAEGGLGTAEGLVACSLAAFVDLERAKARVARGVVISKETIRIEREHWVRGRSERRRAGLDMVDECSFGLLGCLSNDNGARGNQAWPEATWTQSPKAGLPRKAAPPGRRLRRRLELPRSLHAETLSRSGV